MNNRYYPQILRGGAELDRRSPGWYKTLTHADIVGLNMNSHTEDVISTLCRVNVPAPGVSQYSTELGMSLEPSGSDKEGDFAHLNEGWREYITLRQQLPDLPENFVYVGMGYDNAPRSLDMEIALVWAPGFGESWSNIGTVSGRSDDLHYATSDENYARRFIDGREELESASPVEEVTPDDAMEVFCDGSAIYMGYTFSESDISQIVDIATVDTELADSGLSVEVTSVKIGGTSSTTPEILELHARYKKLKEQAAEPTVRAGDRVQWVGGGPTYIVACVGQSRFMLISLTDGNRWNDTVAEADANTAVPLSSFVDDVPQWRKV